MIILGIDPGIAITGFGVVEITANRLTPIDYGVIRTIPDHAHPARLLLLHQELSAIIDRIRPDAVAVETLFFSKNVKTAMAVSEARGVILLTAEIKGQQISHYTPNEIKLAVTGYGGADKTQIQKMTKSLLNLATIPKPDDAADALAVAICHGHSFRLKSLSV